MHRYKITQLIYGGESDTNGQTTITKSFDGDEQYGFVISKVTQI